MNVLETYYVSPFILFKTNVHQVNGSNQCKNYKDCKSYKKIAQITVGGTTGEGTLLSVNERKQLTETWAKASKVNHLHLMIHVGGVAPIDVQDLVSPRNVYQFYPN